LSKHQSVAHIDPPFPFANGDIRYETPKIAIAGLNPHCGDGDIYGVTEETTVIEPCIAKCNLKPGYDIVGPLPGDTCFMKAVRGDFDAVVVSSLFF
jgi:4-hydroxythreonine-4-phosphate dehydrogenase